MILSRAIGEALGQPFVWGRHDCLLWACDVVQAISADGVDLAAEYRGRYDNAAGAARFIRKTVAGGGLADAVAHVLARYGVAEIGPLHAWRGDLALAELGLGAALGIVADAGVAFLAPDGLIFLPRTAARRAWRVG
jgi:hypothetical protein